MSAQPRPFRSQQAETMDEARLNDLLSVMAADRIAAHIAGLRAELTGLVGPEAPGLPETPVSEEWTGIARRAHSAAGHAYLLGFPGIGALLNQLEAAARASDPDAAAPPISALRAQHDAGAPRLPPL